MLEKTMGLVLGSIPYNDHTYFIHIYTEKFGKVTFKASFGKSRKASAQRRMFAPTTILEMEIERSENNELCRIKESSVFLSPLTSFEASTCKYSQCLYIAELLDKTIKEVEHNQALWDYLFNALNILSLDNYNSNNFHLLFTAKLLYFIGIGIDNSNYKKGMRFDFNEGIFTEQAIPHPYYLNSISAEYLNNLLCYGFDNISEYKLNKTEQNTMLDILISYLKLHIPEVGDLKSVDVIKNLF